MPDTLFESELFGYEKGAFTGAHDRKPGRIELAKDGTLFLDEIGDLSMVAQAKLLRVLEERRIERLGGQESIEVNFRLISATNRPLDQFVRDGRFREDLYYRVNAFSIRLPSPAGALLRHSSAGTALAGCVLCREWCAARQQGLRIGHPGSLDVVSLARKHPRAREHDLAGRPLGPRAGDSPARHRVPPASEAPADVSPQRLPSLREAERTHIVRVLEDVGWNKKQAAQVLEISRGTLYRKIGEYSLEPEAQPGPRTRTRGVASW